MLIAPVRIALLPQGFNLGPQASAEGMKLENVSCVKNMEDFYVNFDRTCQDCSFAARIKVGTQSDSQRNEHGKCLLGKKT